MANIVYQGDDLDISCEAQDASGNPDDLTGASLFCDAVLAYSVGSSKVAALGQMVDDGPKGLARVRFTGVQTAALPAGEYTYDVRAQLTSGLLRTIGVGSFIVAAAVTPTP